MQNMLTMIDQLIPIDQVNHLKKKLSVLSRPRCREIIDLLMIYEDMVVTDLMIKLRCEQSIVSQELAKLRNIGLVTYDRDGKYIKYKVLKSEFSKLQNLLNGTDSNRIYPICE